MRKIGYLRVSTQDQRADRQIEGLQGLCDELHIEVVSAANRKRPVYKSITRRLKPGDVFMVWDLDRAYRSTVEALNEAEKFRQRGVAFHLASLNILDTSSPAGVFILSMLASLAEFERRTLSERTKQGLAAARARGARLGRPPKLLPEHLKDARRLLDEGNRTISEVARKFNVAPWSLTRALRRAEGNTGVVPHA